MKVFYTLLLSGLLSLLATGLFGQTLGVTLTDAEGDVGETICLDVIGENFDSLAGFQFSLNYDPAMLRFVGGTGMVGPASVQFNENANSLGSIRVNWTIGVSTSGFSSAAPFDFGDLCFEILATGPATVAFVNTPIPFDFARVDNSEVTDFMLNDGTITGTTGTAVTCDDGIQNGNETGVDCGGDCNACPPMTCGEGTDAVSICVGAVCADAGAEVCVPVFIGNFDMLGGFQFSLAYQAANLDFSRVIPASDLDFGTTTNTPEDGRFNLVWNDLSGSGQSFPADQLAYEICFTVENASATPVTFFNPDMTLRAFEPIMGGPLPVEGNPGSINAAGCGDTTPTCTDGIQNGDETGIDCGGSCDPCVPTPTCDDGIQNGDETGIDCGGSCEPCDDGGTIGGPNTNCGMGTDDVSFCLGTACSVPVGSEVCLDLTVGNYDAITTFEFPVTYPAANLTFTRVTSSAGIMPDITATSSDPGQVDVLYFDFGQSGQTFDDGTVIGSICFTNNVATETQVSIGEITTTNSDFDGLTGTGNPGFVNAADCPTGNTPTCDDGIQNGDETGVDCGGSCEPCDDGGITGGPNTDCGMGTDDVSFCLGTACSVPVGSEVCLDLTVGNYDAITTFEFPVTYPAANLTFTRVTSSPDIMPAITATSNDPGQVDVLYFDFGQTGQTFDDGTIVGSICFTNNVTTETQVSIGEIVTTNANFDNLTGVGNPGFVNDEDCSTGNTPTCDDGIQNGDETGVDCGGSCEPCMDMDTCDDGVQNGDETGIDCGGSCEPCDDGMFDNLTFQVTDAFGAIGTEVCVEVNAFSFTDVTGFRLPVTYDPTKLDFISATGQGQFAGLTSSNTNLGEIRTLFNSVAGTTVTVADETTIMELCFLVLEQCSTPVRVTDVDDYPIEVTAADGSLITPVDVIDGTINGGLPCDDTPPPGNVILQFNSVDGAVGDEVCLDLRATDFMSLTDLSFSLTYDPGVVTFNQVNNIGLAGLSISNISNPTPGVITFEWDSPTAGGESLTDGGVIASFCFTVDRVSSTQINFTNAPVTVNAVNSNGDLVTVVPVGGRINPNTPAVDGLTFQIGSATAPAGDTVCLPIVGFNMDSLVSYQYTIRYNPDVVEYTGRGTDIVFPLAGNMFINNAQPGILRVIWNDPRGEGNINLPDGTALYSLCFRVITVEPTLVAFSGNPTPVEFQIVRNGEPTEVPASLFNGQINPSQAPAIVDSDARNPTCSDLENGSISIFVAGSGTYTYEWTGSSSTTSVANNLAAGTYSVTVTSSNGETTMMDFTLTAPPAFNLGIDEVTSVGCNNESNGRIVISTIGGAAPYLIDWSGSLPDNVLVQNDLAAGTYSVTVTDGNGCTRLVRQIEITEPDPILIAGTVTPLSPGPGAINVVVDGGTGDYSYSWAGPEGFTAMTEDLTDLTAPGEYCLTVTDENDCSSTQCFTTIVAITATVVSVNPGCFGEDNASIDVTVTGGDGEYDFTWVRDGMTVSDTEDLNNVPPGEYTLTITSGGATETLVVPVTAPTQILPNATVTQADAGNNGSITLAPTGGVAPLAFVWGDGTATRDRTMLTPGEYCVTITDANECTIDQCFTVGGTDFQITMVDVFPTTCNDALDGRAVLDFTGGAAPFTITVAPTGQTVMSNQPRIELTLGGGTFSITVTDATGMSDTEMVTVEAPDAITSNLAIVSDTEDMGCTGSIDLNLAGGTGSYQIAWSNGAGTAVIGSLCPGAYSATVTDENGCTFMTGDITIGQVTEELVAITSVACEDGADGSIDVTIDGGVGPLTFSWVLANTADVIASTEDLMNVGAGVYTLTATDATGATIIRNYTVDVAAGFTVTSEATSDFNGFGVSCPGAADGSISTTVSGASMFTYEYFLGDQLVGADAVLTDAVAGTYTIRVTGPGGCESTREVVLTEPTPVMVATTVVPVSCSDETDGSIRATPSGGVSPYSFAWSTGEGTSRITGLEAGDYSLTVTDGNGCVAVEDFTITQPEALAFTFDATDATDGCNGSIRALPLGGSGTYRYSWPELPNQGNNPFAEGLCPGDYTIIVTDENGCQSVTMIATVRDRRFPCLSAREVITPNQDGMNESLIIFCSGDDVAVDNTIQIFNRWGQLVFETDDYNCSEDNGLNCFDGRTNDGALLPEGAYYFIFDYGNLLGERDQLRGSFTILRD